MSDGIAMKNTTRSPTARFSINTFTSLHVHCDLMNNKTHSVCMRRIKAAFDNIDRVVKTQQSKKRGKREEKKNRLTIN